LAPHRLGDRLLDWEGHALAVLAHDLEQLGAQLFSDGPVRLDDVAPLVRPNAKAGRVVVS
jgi:hypothetical protein